jgi:hypothetical protein
MKPKELPLTIKSSVGGENHKLKNPRKRGTRKCHILPHLQLGNRGNHFVTFAEYRGQCEVCSEMKIQCRPHSKCKTSEAILCSNKRKNHLAEYHTVSAE